MSEMNIRADAVDVEQLMRQIRARIREKRGADYTEEEIRELAAVKVEKFIDPGGLRSDLVEEFRKSRPKPLATAPIRNAAPAAAMPKHLSEPWPNFAFDENTLYATHRGPLRFIRRLLSPILKLFFNPNTITAALHIQSRVNQLQAEMFAWVTEQQGHITRQQSQLEDRLRAIEDRMRDRADREALYYELMHNITLEVTRSGIEVHNIGMRMESLASRLEFDERRGRALEGVVQYRAFTPQRVQTPSPATAPAGSQPGVPTGPSGTAAGTSVRPAETGDPAGGDRRRRRRRRRRRPGQTMADGQNRGAGSATTVESGGPQDTESSGMEDDGLDDSSSSESTDESDGTER